MARDAWCTLSWVDTCTESDAKVKRGYLYKIDDEQNGWVRVQDLWVPAYCFDKSNLPAYSFIQECNTDDIKGVVGDHFYEIERNSGWSKGYLNDKLIEMPTLFIENNVFPDYYDKLLAFCTKINDGILIKHCLTSGMKYYIETVLSENNKIRFALSTPKKRIYKLTLDFIKYNKGLDGVAIHRLTALKESDNFEKMYEVVDYGFNIGKALNPSAVVMSRVSRVLNKEPTPSISIFQ